MSKLTLYYTPISPLSRSCLLLARYLKLDLDIISVDLEAREQYSEEFLKINPEHKVPVLVDDDFVVCESRAILAYLVSQFEPESDLLPKDPRKRANVDQRLYYDATVVFEKVIALIRLGFQKDIKLIPHETRGATWNMLTRLDELLKQSDYIAGENLTIADFSIITSVSTLNKFGYDLSAYEHLNKWFENLHSLPYFEENLAGAEVIADKLKSAFDGPLY